MIESRTCDFTRRAFLARAATITGLFSISAAINAQPNKTRLILLGTGGGPRPRRASSGSAQVIVRNGVAYVIDCGDGVARQLVFADVPLPTLRHIFLTHHHSDHNADYGNLIWLAWTAGLNTRVDTWGPPPIQKMTPALFRDEQIRHRCAHCERRASTPGPTCSRTRAAKRWSGDER